MGVECQGEDKKKNPHPEELGTGRKREKYYTLSATLVAIPSRIIAGITSSAPSGIYMYSYMT